jgi:uncharacterized protein (TIGR02246 family)
MRKINLTVFGLIAICLLAALGALAQGGSVEQTIKALTEQWRHALLKSDAAAYAKLTAEDFITIGTAGRAFTKAQIVEFLKSGELKYETYDYSDIKIRLYKDTALVNCILNQKGRVGDRDLIAGPFLVVLVWVRRNGQWQTVSWQGTRAAPQP